MPILTKAQLEALNQASFPDQSTEAITPAILRTYNTATIDTLVDSLDTGSFVQDLTSLNAFTQSQLSINAALNASTASQQVSINALNTFTQSQDTKNSTLATYTGSNDTKWNTLGGQTGSYVTSAVTGSSLITASFSGNTLTFTKGDSSTFGVVIPDVSGSTIPAGTISGSSQITALGFVSSSVTGSSLVTGSVVGNVLTFTKGDATQFSLTVATGSGGGGTIDTGSFATTGSNVFVGDQTIQSDGTKNGIFFISGSEFFVGQNEVGRFVISSSNQNRWMELNNDNGYAEVYAQNTNFNNTVSLRGRTEARGIFQQAGYPVEIAGTLSASLQAGYAFVGGADGYSKQVPTASFAGAVPVGTATTGSNAFFGDQTISGSLVVSGSEIITGTLTASLQEGYAWVGGVGNISTLVPTSSFGGGGTINTGSFATTGSNIFTGNQTIQTSSILTVGSDDEYIRTAFNTLTLNNKTAVFTNFQAPDTYFQANGNFAFQNTIGGNGSGSMNFLIQNGGSYSTQVQGGGTIGFTTNTGSISLSTQGELSLQSNVLKLKSADANFNTQIVNVSGSLMLIAQSQSTASAHIAQASPANSFNLIFKPNNNTGATVISGSSNIFTNAATPTTGYTRYIGGSNNLYLNQTNGINSQITASAASVSGNRPTMNGNIMPGTGDFVINQATNPGTHTYSSNIIFGQGGQTLINALGFTGSLNINSNISSTSGIVVNPASASIAQIATGISGSGTVTISSNLVQGGSIANTSPRFLLPTNTQTMANNVVAGTGITVTNISSSAAVNSSGNFATGQMNYLNAGAAGLGLHTSVGSMSTNFGAMQLIASASAINATGNISPTAMTVTNRMYSGSVIGSGSLAFANNQIQGGGNTYTATGSWGGTGAGATMAANGVFGVSNTIFTNVEGRGSYADFRSNLIGGSNLILTGSNNNTITANGGGYFGRYNADDGRRNGTGENIFVVGTGTSTERKTGFLIDSGSNTFIEGTLNVSGSTTITGSLNVTSLIVSGSTQFNVGAFNSTITQSGSAAVSQSMTFNNTDITEGVTLNGGGTQLTLTNSGTYNIQFSAQLLAATGQDDIYIWLKKNGTNVSNTATKLVLGNNEASVAAWNFVVPAAASDYFELAWQNRDGHTLLSAGTATGNIPAIPSVIVTVTQVR